MVRRALWKEYLAGKWRTELRQGAALNESAGQNRDHTGERTKLET